MSDIPSSNTKAQIEAASFRAPVSESLLQGHGAAINYALDQVAANASAIATETSNRIVDVNAEESARISADNTINAKVAYRPPSVGGGGLGSVPSLGFGSTGSFFSNGDIIDENTISLSVSSSASSTALVIFSFRCERSETSYRQSGIYLDITNDPDYATQRLFPQITEESTSSINAIYVGGSFSITLPKYALTSPTTNIRVRLIANDPTFSTAGRYNRWEYKYDYRILDPRTIGS